MFLRKTSICFHLFAHGNFTCISLFGPRRRLAFSNIKPGTKSEIVHDVVYINQYTYLNMQQDLIQYL